MLLRWMFVIGMFVLVTSIAHAESDNIPLKGTEVVPEATLMIDLPEAMPTGNDMRAGGIQHLIEVSGIYTGQRIALPRAIDGTCRYDAVVTIDGGPELRVEIDPDHRHWVQHQLTSSISTQLDEATCEVVVTEARATDLVRRRHLKHGVPHPLRGVLATPVPQTSVAPRDYFTGFTPCLLYRFDQYARWDIVLARSPSIPRVRSRVRQRYFDYPYQDIFLLWTHSALQWANTAAQYWVLFPPSSIEWIVSPPYANAAGWEFFGSSRVNAVHRPSGAGFTASAVVDAYPGGEHHERVGGTLTRVVGSNTWTHTLLKRFRIYDAWYVC